jgi:glucose/mannose-6-phosphate isomerase
LINESDIKTIDSSGMYHLIKSFPDQAAEAIKIAKKTKLKLSNARIKNIVITGLGGSAIGGDILRSYAANQSKIPIVVNRSYVLPEFVDRNTLVVVSSYSGNTEETISAYSSARKREAQILVVTSGGAIGETAVKLKHNLIEIPGGLPPRAALGYSFFTVLTAFQMIGILKYKPRETRETIELLRHLSNEYSEYSNNPKPLALAERMINMLPIIYAATERFDAVNLRWRGQISENAKTVAYGNLFPEMNHNEIVGYSTLKDLLSRFFVVILRDEEDHPRVKARFELVKEIIRPYCSEVIEVNSQGKSLLARMFSLIHFSDWLSFYLAIKKGVDPTPVTNIDLLKKRLSEF